MSRIDVTIDRIVLSGIDAGSRDAFVAGLREALTSALAEPAPAAFRSRRTPVVRVGGLTLDPGSTGARSLGAGVGAAIARNVTSP